VISGAGRLTPRRVLLAEHAHAARTHKEDASQDNKQATAPTTCPGAIGTLGIIVTAAAEQWSAAAKAHFRILQPKEKEQPLYRRDKAAFSTSY
jgi:hypothetical protein